MQKIPEDKLKSFLLEFGLISPEDLKKAEKKALEQKKPLEEVLLDEGYLKEDEFYHIRAYIFGFPFINLEGKKIPQEILQIIPLYIAKRYKIVPYRKQGNNLEVAMLNPEDLEIVEFLKKKTKLNILPRFTTPKAIEEIIAQYEAPFKKELEKILKEKPAEIKILKEKEEKISEKEKKELEKKAVELPVVKVVDTILKQAILKEASDIHIPPQDKEVLVRYRIDGILRDIMILPKEFHPGIVARIKVISNLKLDEHRLPQDGRFKIEKGKEKISFRVSILPTMYGEKVVMRLLFEKKKKLSFEELGLYGKSLERVYRALKRPNGMILITGPTGSGKTTTLYTMLQFLNTPEVNISTIEDPIEYTLPRITQTQVNPKIGLTFASGLRALLRQDPDIIMVGEIRDKETASLAVNAALTGHLVLSTLHTTSAVGAIPRLIDLGIEPFLLASTLRVIIAQRLVRKLTSKKSEHFLSNEEVSAIQRKCDPQRLLEILRKEKATRANSLKEVKFAEPLLPEGSPERYKGRTGIFEVLEVSRKIRNLILKGGSPDEIQKTAQEQGMYLMIEDGFVKAAKGITTIEEVLRVTAFEE